MAARPPAGDTAQPAPADPGIVAAFDALAAQCPAPFRDELRRPSLRAPDEIASYHRRVVTHAAAFGTSVPARAWSPLRDLAIAEVEADRYATAIGGIVRHARAAVLTDLLAKETEARTGRRRTADDERACQTLARSWVAGVRDAEVEVAIRLGRLGHAVPVVDDLAHARELSLVTKLEHMRTNASRSASRIRRLLETIWASERDEQERQADQDRPGPPEAVGSTAMGEALGDDARGGAEAPAEAGAGAKAGDDKETRAFPQEPASDPDAVVPEGPGPAVAPAPQSGPSVTLEEPSS